MKVTCTYNLFVILYIHYVRLEVMSNAFNKSKIARNRVFLCGPRLLFALNAASSRVQTAFFQQKAPITHAVCLRIGFQASSPVV